MAADFGVVSGVVGAFEFVVDGPAVALPMLGAGMRFCAARASAMAFSRMAFCFSSSFARMGTKSSGMGLVS